jgi:nitrous oxide reductase accessory protein NosL
MTMREYYLVKYENMEGRADEQTFYNVEDAKRFAKMMGGKLIKITEEEILL